MTDSFSFSSPHKAKKPSQWSATAAIDSLIPFNSGFVNGFPLGRQDETAVVVVIWRRGGW
jgi:hypothetical protein